MNKNIGIKKKQLQKRSMNYMYQCDLETPLVCLICGQRMNQEYTQHNFWKMKKGTTFTSNKQNPQQFLMTHGAQSLLLKTKQCKK